MPLKIQFYKYKEYIMTPNELAELLNYVNEKHGWENMYTNVAEGRKIVKYVDVCMDTRDGQIWISKIKFRQLCSNLKNDQEYDNVVFQEENGTKEKILEWLGCN